MNCFIHGDLESCFLALGVVVPVRREIILDSEALTLEKVIDFCPCGFKSCNEDLND